MVLLTTLRAGQKGGPSGILEYLTDTFTSLGRAFKVVLSTNLLGHCHTLQEMRKDAMSAGDHRRRGATHLLGRDWALVCLAQLLDNSRVPPEVLLATDKDDRKASTEVHHLGDPLLGLVSA